jgi:hypothetical protein
MRTKEKLIFFAFCPSRQRIIHFFSRLIVVVTSAYSNNGTSVELVQRYKESVAPSELAYHSTETINEALTPPWALHFELKRRPATPNLPSNTTQSRLNE